MSAEAAVRARAVQMLGDDAALGAWVHGVFDGEPPRSTAPFVAVGGAEGIDWGTKDRAGREVRLSVTLVGVGDSLDGAAEARVEALISSLRGNAGAWMIAGARVVRTRFSRGKDGGWRHDWVIRCRCLANA